MGDSFLPVCRVVAIDIGTVTCRMLVADVDAQGGMRELCREYAIANLGEGVDATHRLKPQAIERVADIVKRYLAKLESLNDAAHNPFGLKPRIVALATSASRDAENAADFTNRMRDLGVDLKLLFLFRAPRRNFPANRRSSLTSAAVRLKSSQVNRGTPPFWRNRLTSDAVA